MTKAIAVKNAILLNQKKVKIQVKETIKVVQNKTQVKTKPVKPEMVSNVKRKLDTLGGYAGRVMVGDKKQPICIPANSSKVVVGRTRDKLPR